MTNDLLLEIGTEELPAAFLPTALKDLAAIAKDKFSAARINCEAIETFGTPRRMTLFIKNVAASQTDKISENKGPALKIAFDEAAKPTKAAEGFARGQKVDVNDLVIKDGYVFAAVHEVGRKTEQLLPELLAEITGALNFAKSMRWGEEETRFARPLRWLVALFNEKIISFSFAGVTSGNITCGHRFLSQGAVKVDSPADYFIKMAQNKVIVNQNIRRELIREQVEKLAADNGGAAGIDEALLEEVLYLVEYPTALYGSFSPDYLNLPKEVLITSMREHQRYFPVFAPDGALKAAFITVRNGGEEYIDIVRRGNERVLKARLSDAKFFFEEDIRTPLYRRVEKLKTIVYQEGLGTLLDKSERLEKITVFIAGAIGLDESLSALILRSAHLAKADLVTGMVYEFPELQGVMGREYSRLDGEGKIVSQAIFEQYLPRFAGDILPESAAGAILSIADKIDNITATFSRGLIPSGSQDPFALRRQALGIVNILIKSKIHLSLSAISLFSFDLFGINDAERRSGLLKDIGEFFRLRLKNVLSEEANLSYDLVDAVLAAGIDDCYDVYLRALALGEESKSPELEAAAKALARAANLVKNITEKFEIDKSLFESQAEKELYEAYLKVKDEIDVMIKSKDYRRVFKQAAALAAPIGAFFEQVMVMDENPALRNNRLALLQKISALTETIADLSKITAG